MVIKEQAELNSPTEPSFPAMYPLPKPFRQTSSPQYRDRRSVWSCSGRIELTKLVVVITGENRVSVIGSWPVVNKVESARTGGCSYATAELLLVNFLIRLAGHVTGLVLASMAVAFTAVSLSSFASCHPVRTNT
jgi:hypothetical protein